MNRILIVGGTGRVGREVLAQLTPLGVTVRALVRDPANAQLPPHVEAVFGDLTRPETLDSCINGVDAVFIRFTVGEPWFHPGADHEHRIAGDIVIAAVRALGGGQPAKLAAE